MVTSQRKATKRRWRRWREGNKEMGKEGDKKRQMKANKIEKEKK